MTKKTAKHAPADRADDIQMRCPACGSRYPVGADRCVKDRTRLLEADALVGETLGDGYLVDKLVRSDALGRLYEASRAKDQARKFAVFAVHASYAQDPAVGKRFLASATTLRGLDQPHIAATHELGRTDDGRPFVVSDHPEGKPLATVLARGKLPQGEAVRLIRQICRALAAAHLKRVVHHYIHPETVYVVGEGERRQCTIVGLGLAGFRSASLQRGAADATAPYAAPEQSSGETVDHRADIYAVGGLLFAALTGKPPVDPIAGIGVPAPRSVLPSIPQALEAIILRAMASSPADRYGFMNQLDVELMPHDDEGADLLDEFASEFDAAFDLDSDEEDRHTPPRPIKVQVPDPEESLGAPRPTAKAAPQPPRPTPSSPGGPPRPGAPRRSGVAAVTFPSTPGPPIAQRREPRPPVPGQPVAEPTVAQATDGGEDVPTLPPTADADDSPTPPKGVPAPQLPDLEEMDDSPTPAKGTPAPEPRAPAADKAVSAPTESEPPRPAAEPADGPEPDQAEPPKPPADADQDEPAPAKPDRDVPARGFFDTSARPKKVEAPEPSAEKEDAPAPAKRESDRPAPAPEEPEGDEAPPSDEPAAAARPADEEEPAPADGSPVEAILRRPRKRSRLQLVLGAVIVVGVLVAGWLWLDKQGRQAQPAPDRTTPSAAPAPTTTAPTTESVSATAAADPQERAHELRDQLQRAIVAAKHDDAVEALEGLAELEPAVLGSIDDVKFREALLELLVRATRFETDKARRVYELAAKKLGSIGPDLLFELLTTKGGSEAASRAANLLADGGVRKLATPELRIAYHLRMAANCDAVRQLLDRATKAGDHRSKAELERIKACGAGARCCLRRDEEVNEAIDIIGARVSGVPATGAEPSAKPTAPVVRPTSPPKPWPPATTAAPTAAPTTAPTVEPPPEPGDEEAPYD